MVCNLDHDICRCPEDYLIILKIKMSPTFRLLFFSVIRTVAAWAAERATHDATQIGVASGYLHHKSLGVPPQSWRHVDHPRWTLGPTICWLLVQLTLLHSTAMDIFYARVPELHWWSKLGFPSLLSVPSPRILSFPYSCCSSTENLYPPPSNFCFLRFFFFFFSFIWRGVVVYVCDF